MARNESPQFQTSNCERMSWSPGLYKVWSRGRRKNAGLGLWQTQLSTPLCAWQNCGRVTTSCHPASFPHLIPLPEMVPQFQ